MSFPLVGVGLPVLGVETGPSAIAEVAQTAEELGFAAVSVFERLLLPADAAAYVKAAETSDRF